MDEEEKMILAHEPVPGYRRVFHIVVFVAAVFLAGVFIKAFL